MIFPTPKTVRRGAAVVVVLCMGFSRVVIYECCLDTTKSVRFGRRAGVHTVFLNFQVYASPLMRHNSTQPGQLVSSWSSRLLFNYHVIRPTLRMFWVSDDCCHGGCLMCGIVATCLSMPLRGCTQRTHAGRGGPVSVRGGAL